MVNPNKGVESMKRLDFMVECGKRLIDVGIALENDNLVEALKDKDDSKAISILDTEF